MLTSTSLMILIWIFDDWRWMLGQNCQISGDHGYCRKTLKYAEVAQIRKFCKSRYAHEKFTVLIITLWPPQNCTAWWQKKLCVNNLPRMVTWGRMAEIRTCKYILTTSLHSMPSTAASIHRSVSCVTGTDIKDYKEIHSNLSNFVGHALRVW